jgi:NADH-quinone oxidoreductase subunit E
MAQIGQEIAPFPEQKPDPVIPADQLVWTAEEQQLVDRFRAQYPEPEAAVMKVLWLAQEKWGWLPPEVIQFCADSLDIEYARAYGVATFYTMYFKQNLGKHVLEVCTCFSCQVCGGYDALHYLEKKLGIHSGETTPDGLFHLREAECLGACGSAPMMQVTNGEYLHNLTETKLDQLIEDLRAGKHPQFESVTLPQDEDEMGGNRRTDVTQTVASQPPPVSKTVG